MRKDSYIRLSMIKSAFVVTIAFLFVHLNETKKGKAIINNLVVIGVMTKVYAGRIKKRDVLNHCSSGGAFTVLSDVFLNNSNAVLCAGYNYNSHQTEFRLLFTFDERDMCRGSMYMQSYALDSWREALEWLKEHSEKKLIFFGVGCQGSAFLDFCKKNNILDRVTVVDIICHGVPSPMIWKEYVAALEKKGKLSNINFRDKRNGWNKSIGIAKQNGVEISLSKWRRAYSSRIMLRPCCAYCPYTTVERETDITIGDFWHLEKSIPDFFDDKGTSVFLIHTEKGMELFSRIKEKIDYQESSTKDCLQMNLEKPTEHADTRTEFWRDYRTKGIDFVMEKYGTISFIRRVKRKMNKLLNIRGGV